MYQQMRGNHQFLRQNEQMSTLKCQPDDPIAAYHKPVTGAKQSQCRRVLSPPKSVTEESVRGQTTPLSSEVRKRQIVMPAMAGLE